MTLALSDIPGDPWDYAEPGQTVGAVVAGAPPEPIHGEFVLVKFGWLCMRIPTPEGNTSPIWIRTSAIVSFALGDNPEPTNG